MFGAKPHRLGLVFSVQGLGFRVFVVVCSDAFSRIHSDVIERYSVAPEHEARRDSSAQPLPPSQTLWNSASCVIKATQLQSQHHTTVVFHST